MTKGRGAKEDGGAAARGSGIAVDLTGRAALVTGAARGIGASIVRTLAHAGARVALHFNTSRALAEGVAAEIAQETGYPPVLVAADLSRSEERRRLYKEAMEGLGTEPDILVNNAARVVENAFEEPNDELWLARWQATITVNLEASAHLTFLALPAMRRRRFGRIVMIASRSAFRAETDHPDYAVSKAGMVNLARCLARNEGRHGITANSVCPGWVDTELVAERLAERGDAIRAEIPLGRFATTQDVANAVLFYVSSLGDYANGTALGLNGGSYLH